MTDVIKGDKLETVERETLNDMLWKSIEKHANIDAVKLRSGNGFKSLSYREFGEDIRNLSQGLISLGIEKGDKVSILADTRYEWGLADFAIHTAGGVCVTIYPTLTAGKAKYIIENSDSKIVFVENQEQLDKIVQVYDELPDLQYIITIENTTKPLENVIVLEEAMELGKKFDKDNPGRYEEIWKSVKPDDLSSIVYTSGTTGLPKGAMISHWNWRFNITSVVSVVTFKAGLSLLAFLPLAHVYMRIVYFAAVYAGGTTYFSNPQQLADDLPKIRPDVFVSVPRLFERVNDRIVDQMNEGPGYKKKLFHWSAEVARQAGYFKSLGKPLPFKLQLKQKLADKLVYSKIREKMGVDKLKWTVSAGSALSKELAYFYSGLGILIIEGYGMTESSAPSNLNPVHLIKPGTVGPPLPGTMQKLADDGEILIKGDHVMQGYYKLPEETKASFTEDGWLKTGDIGMFDKDGYLTFKERKKHILVLSTGKNIAPLPMEEGLKKSRLVDDAVVLGDDRKFICALIQPAYDYIAEYAEKNNIDYNKKFTTYAEGTSGDQVIVKVDPALLENERIMSLYQEIVDEVNKGFENFEQIKRFRLLPDALSMEKGELTPTFKVKRNVVAENYEGFISGMYQ